MMPNAKFGKPCSAALPARRRHRKTSLRARRPARAWSIQKGRSSTRRSAKEGAVVWYTSGPICRDRRKGALGKGPSRRKFPGRGR